MLIAFVLPHHQTEWFPPRFRIPFGIGDLRRQEVREIREIQGAFVDQFVEVVVMVVECPSLHPCSPAQFGDGDTLEFGFHQHVQECVFEVLRNLLETGIDPSEVFLFAADSELAFVCGIVFVHQCLHDLFQCFGIYALSFAFGAFIVMICIRTI